MVMKFKRLQYMNKWDFVIKELKSLQKGFEDHQAITELFVEQKLLYGYKIVDRMVHEG